MAQLVPDFTAPGLLKPASLLRRAIWNGFEKGLGRQSNDLLTSR
jgi:hypothetical protein